MKWWLVVVVLVILLSPVSAELSFSCDEDSDCFLYTGKPGACVEFVCDFGKFEPHELFFMVHGEVQWAPVAIVEEDYVSLLDLAPEEKRIWDFVFDARSWLL